MVVNLQHRGKPRRGLYLPQDKLEFPEQIDLTGSSAYSQFIKWASYIVEQDLRDISIARVIDFVSLEMSGRDIFETPYWGIFQGENEPITWNTQGLPPENYRRHISGVSFYFNDEMDPSKSTYMIIALEGYPISGNLNPHSFFEVRYYNYYDFRNDVKKIWGQ